LKHLSLGFMAPRPDAEALSIVREAERLGYGMIWSAENYGYDCFTGLAWWAAHTEKIGLGTTVAVVDARTPTSAAMAAVSLDQLSGGRFTLGFGVSGPLVVEGWYGRDFRRPLARTREYVGVVRDVLARNGPLQFAGDFYQFPSSAGTGLGKPLKLIPHPVRQDLPVFLAAEGPKNVALAGEIADGWCGFYMSNSPEAEQWTWLGDGFARRTGGRPGSFQVVSQVSLSVDDDIERAADAVRPNIAFMVGGMGGEDANYHYAALARAGFAQECEQIARRWRDGDRGGAASAVSTKMAAATALIGPWDAIRDSLARWRETPVTSVLVTPSRGTALTEDLLGKLADAAWS
jgi:F420-dependent oxidoreductase-like protein